MIITATQVLTLLGNIAHEAQQSGLVPDGPATVTLGLLVAGLHGVLTTEGVLRPSSAIELNEIGDDFQAAMAHMRAVLAQRAPLGDLPPA